MMEQYPVIEQPTSLPARKETNGWDSIAFSSMIVFLLIIICASFAATRDDRR